MKRLVSLAIGGSFFYIVACSTTVVGAGANEEPQSDGGRSSGDAGTREAFASTEDAATSAKRPSPTAAEAGVRRDASIDVNDTCPDDPKYDDACFLRDLCSTNPLCGSTPGTAPHCAPGECCYRKEGQHVCLPLLR